MMKCKITRKQINTIYRAMREYKLDYNKEVISFLYDEVADHEFEVSPENESDYTIFRTVKGVVDSILDPDGYWPYGECNLRLRELVEGRKEN